MARGIARFALVSLSLVVGILWLMTDVSGQGTRQPSTANGEWPTYNADVKGSRYSPLDQINATRLPSC